MHSIDVVTAGAVLVSLRYSNSHELGLILNREPTAMILGWIGLSEIIYIIMLDIALGVPDVVFFSNYVFWSCWLTCCVQRSQCIGFFNQAYEKVLLLPETIFLLFLVQRSFGKAKSCQDSCFYCRWFLVLFLLKLSRVQNAFMWYVYSTYLIIFFFDALEESLKHWSRRALAWSCRSTWMKRTKLRLALALALRPQAL